MRVLVTGGAGFVGSHLVRALLERGDAVRVLDDLSTGRRERVAPPQEGLEWIPGDVRDAGAVARAARGVDAVLHQAAMVSVPESTADPAGAMDVNGVGTARVLHEALQQGCPRFVLASSSAVYGPGADVPTPESAPLRPASPYGASKVAAEHVLGACARADGVVAISLRYFNVYGPGQVLGLGASAVIPAFITAALLGEPLRVHGSGEQTRDLCHVSDVVRANLLALEADPALAGRAFNVGTGVGTSVAELARLVRAATERAGPPPVHEPVRRGDVDHSRADTTRAAEDLGFVAEVALAEGLAETVAAGLPLRPGGA